MTAELSTTSRTPSQASTMIRDSIEPGQSALTPPPSIPQGVQHPGSTFQPLQMLMDTVITIEYGDGLQYSCSVHEGIMCCNSQQVQSWCAQAKPLHAKYTKCEEVAQKLVCISMQGISKTKFEENDVEAQVLKVVGYIHAHYPLDQYGQTIVKQIERVLVTQITEKHVKNVPITPKTNSKTYHDLSFNGRLDLLDYEGMVNVIERVSSMLGRIKALEREKAKEDALKAMAQKRILLPGVTETSVKSLLAWVYHGELRFENSEQLYELYDLAAKLRVDALAERCLSQLSNTASDIIHQADQQGISLGALLGFPAASNGQDTTGDQRVFQDKTVEVIFQRVLKDAKSPMRLVDLVTKILAAGLDLELWAHVQDTMSHAMTLRLVEAMLRQKQVKFESLERHDAVVKLEVQQEVGDARPKPAEAQQQAVLTG